jgi:mannose-6-phosphate isomerase-like protein (cupin superfamily)
MIERGTANPSFATLLKLSSALGVPLSTCFDPPLSTETDAITRRHQRPRLLLPHYSLSYELLTPSRQKSPILLATTVPPGFSNESAPFVHDGQETVHVLDGEIEMGIRDEVHVLEEGDTATFSASDPHWWRNSTSETVRCIALTFDASLFGL